MAMNSSDVVAGQHGYASDYNNLRKDVKNGITNITTATDASTVTFDLTQSKYHRVVLGGNRTLAVSGAVVGQSFVIKLVQDGTGSRTVTWFSTITWPYDVVPTLTTTLNRSDVFGFFCTGSNTYDGCVIEQGV